jgi:hypothetical protein
MSTVWVPFQWYQLRRGMNLLRHVEYEKIITDSSELRVFPHIMVIRDQMLPAGGYHSIEYEIAGGLFLTIYGYETILGGFSILRAPCNSIVKHTNS